MQMSVRLHPELTGLEPATSAVTGRDILLIINELQAFTAKIQQRFRQHSALKWR
jgi:hypothetical protein